MSHATALSQAIHTAGPHSAYSTRVAQKLETIWNSMTVAERADPSVAKARILTLIDDIRTAIANAPNTSLNDLIF